MALWLGVLLHSVLLFVMNQRFPLGALSMEQMETRIQLRQAAELCCGVGTAIFQIGLLILLGLCIAAKSALSVGQLGRAVLAVVLGLLICTVPFAALDRLVLQDRWFWKDYVLALWPVMGQLLFFLLFFLVVVLWQRHRAKG